MGVALQTDGLSHQETASWRWCDGELYSVEWDLPFCLRFLCFSRPVMTIQRGRRKVGGAAQDCRNRFIGP